MLAEDDPELPIWDQDEAAVRGRYAEQDPALVADELADAADAAGALFAGVRPSSGARPGHRSDGAAFTVETLGPVLRPRGRSTTCTTSAPDPPSAPVARPPYVPLT